ncbi:MAG: UDP-N-acetylmuramoyl-L-alanine--D-glutamate ligase [Chloroflexi bacterium]|nr:UDP-N-acetylmuramoyl-L-alanine--D-glutamate ligase [Chloroflexota bacterium]
MLDLQGKRVLVMGLGVHGGGLGVAAWLVRQGARVTVTDVKPAEELRSSLDALSGLPIRYSLGGHQEADFIGSDLVVRNPGVPRESPWLEIARTHGIPVEMEMGLFVERLPRGVAQVVGITGTKGKTTTTLMVGAILKRVNPKTVVAGNLRVSALELLTQIDTDTPVVLELSSWQLEGLQPHRVSPHLAAITNIYPDHLNRYNDLDDYAQAKATVFRFQQPGDYVVLNFDNQPSTRFAPQAFGQVVWTSAKRTLNDGAFRDGAHLVWRSEGRQVPVIRTDALPLPGSHNVENALTAIALTSVWGAAPAASAAGLADVRGVEHREELVAEIAGVRYVDDTTATAPAAAIAAIETWSPAGLILIAGGSDKSVDMTELGLAIAARVRQVVLLAGSATDKLAQAIESAGAGAKIAGRYDDFDAAVQRARSVARTGDVVLLSPGCASFGMFANEFERGDQFKRIVRRLTKP